MANLKEISRQIKSVKNTQKNNKSDETSFIC